MLDRLKMRRERDGFTIIEVLIVLAIAGLIMVVVFLAVPNLQKSQRNNARDTDANNLLQSISAYIGNANGVLPTACTSLSNANCSWITYKPQQLTNVSLDSEPASIPSTPDKTTAYLITGAVCNGLTPAVGAASGASTRDYVIWYGIEGSTATKCTQGS
jgi:prepilin-type N-terminal cleavage/methylation domain-containing protein